MQNTEGRTVSVPDVITMTVRLAQIMAQEVDLLQQMKVSEIEPLQREKLLLAGALDTQAKALSKHPEIMESIGEDELDELRRVAKIFEVVKAENHRRLLMAREVNLKVVEAITEVATESSINGMYGKTGMAEGPGRDTLSVTLNKTV